MNIGKIFFIFTLASDLLSFFVLIYARPKHIGMMARVRVSFTIVAISRALLPACIPSHAEAAAVTEDVSFTAVPANNPKPSVLIPKNVPIVGNINAAITLNKKITDID